MDVKQLLNADTQEVNLGQLVDTGIALCRQERWEEGLDLLRKAARKEVKETPLPGLFYSYLGYGAARFQRSGKEGLALCRHAVEKDPYQPDNYLNLARVYHLRSDRRRAVAALQKGLKLAPRHRGLSDLRDEMGYRRAPVIPFLPRGNALNKWLGKRRYERELEQSAS